VKLIATIAAAILLCFASAFTYVWYQTNNAVKQAIDALSPYAQISYGSIISSVYPGILGIADVSIILEGKRLQAEAITLSADNILDLYALQKNPWLFLVKHPKLHIRGLLSPQPIADFALFDQPFNHPYLQGLANLDAVGCGQRTRIGRDDMQAMGYANLLSDITVLSGPKPFTESAYLFELTSSVRGVADYAMDITFADAPRDIDRGLQRLANLDVDSILLRSKDQGYNPRRMEFCAQQLGMSLAAYEQYHVRAVKKVFQRHSIKLDNATLAAYAQGLHRGASMRLRVKPRPEFALEDLRFYQPDDYFDLLGINFSVNNRAVAKSGTIAADADAAAAAPSENTVALPATATASTAPILASKQLDWSDLDKAVHNRVAVYTQSGGVHRGRLVEVLPNLLVMKKSFGADNMIYRIERRRFNHAELMQ
jgi:hypothetical protein